MFDIIIENGKVVDGTGGPAKKADVGICGEKIAAIGDLSGGQSLRRLDAEGLVVSPGFIDMHTHSDMVLFADGRGESMLRQGVTTNVTGNCGMSPAPLGGEHRDAVIADMSVGKVYGVEPSWNSFGEYLEALSRTPKSLNIAPLVGHGAIRAAAMGLEARLPIDAELLQMKNLVRQSMEEGAFGMSTGLIFPPGMYSDTRELVEVAKSVAEFGGVYSSHIRGETNSIIEAVQEALRICREAGVRTNISHHKAVGRENWGKIHTTHSLIEQAAKEFDVTFDMYPYTTCGGSLSQYPPPWAKSGGTTELYRRLADPIDRSKIRDGILNGGSDFANFYRLYWEDIQVSSVPSEKNSWMEGLRISEIAEKLGKDPVELVMDLMLEEHNQIPVCQHVLSDQDVEFLLAQEQSMIGSDGSAITPDGSTGGGRPHPRSYGSFARVLGYYVREKGVLTLETAIHKMTGKPAAKLRLSYRGLLKERYAADIVVFDPDQIIDKADFINPHQFAEGVHWVLVNGEIALDKGKFCSNYKGTVLSAR